MAIANPASSIPDLPAEGRPLGELIECMVGPEAWIVLTTWVGDRRLSGVIPRFIYFAAECAKGDHDYAIALRACLPLLDSWNAGRLIAKGRRGSPIAPLEEIPSPRVGWTMVIASLLNSTIVEPGTLWKEDRRMIYDLRFYSRDRPAAAGDEPEDVGYQTQRAQEVLKRKWPPYGAPPLGMSYNTVRGVVDEDCVADNKNRGLRTPSLDVVTRLVKANRKTAAKAAHR